MDNVTTGAEPADIVNDVASAAYEDASTSDTKLEVIESIKDGIGDQIPVAEAVSGPLSGSSEDELTIYTDDDEKQVQPEGVGLDPEHAIDNSPAVGSVDDSETSGMETGPSVAGDLISPEEADPDLSNVIEEEPRIDGHDSEKFTMPENLNDAVGETADGEVAEDGVDCAEACDTASEGVVSPEDKNEIENLATGGEISPVEGDGAANVEEGEKIPEKVETDSVAGPLPDDRVPEDTVEEPRNDILAENAVDVNSDVSTTVMAAADAVEEGVQEPESVSEPSVSETPELYESAKGSENGRVDEDGGVSNSPLETAEQPDTRTPEAEAVNNALDTADVVASEIYATVPPESSPSVSVEDSGVSTTVEEQDTSSEDSRHNDPTSSTSREDNEHETQEQAEREEERSLVSYGNELVQDAEVEESAEIRSVKEDDQGAKTNGDESPSPFDPDGTDTNFSNSVEVPETLDADDGLVEVVDKSSQLADDAKEIAEIATNEQEAPISEVQSAAEETESPLTTVPDVPESSPVSSPDASEDSSQVLLPVSDEVVRIQKEPSERSLSMEHEQLGEVEREVEETSASGATETNPLHSADIPEAVEEAEGQDFAGTSTFPSLVTEENLDVTSMGDNAPASNVDEREEEQAVGAESDVETPGGLNLDATDFKILSTNEVSENIDTGRATDSLENGNDLHVTSDADQNEEAIAEDHDMPTSAVDPEEDKGDETIVEFEPLVQTDADAKGFEPDCLTEGFTEGDGTEVAENVDVSSMSPPDAKHIEDEIEQDVAASVSESEAEETSKIHPEVAETVDASNHEEKVDSPLLTLEEESSSKEVVDKQVASICSEEVMDGENTRGSISPWIAEVYDGQDAQVTDLVQTVEIPSGEELSKVEPIVASVTSEEPEEEKKMLPREHVDVGDAEVSERENSVGDTPQLSSSSSSLIEASSPETQEERELQVEAPTATLNDNHISASFQVSAIDESEKEREIGGSESEVEGLTDATADASKDSESSKDIILAVAYSALEQGPGVQELIDHVTENVGSEGDAPTPTEVPENVQGRENTLQNDTPLHASAGEEKVIFATDFQKVSANTEDQEDSADEGNVLPYSSTPSNNSEESLVAKESAGKLENDGSTHAILLSSEPSSDPFDSLREGVVGQKEISGFDEVSVKNIVTTYGPVQAVETATVCKTIANEVKDPLGSNDSKFESLQPVTSPDVQQKEILSLNEANVAAKMKGDFLMGEKNHPLRGQNLLQACKISTVASSGDEEDSLRRRVSAIVIPTVSQEGGSASGISQLQFGAQNVPKDEASVPLSTYSGDESSSWVAVPLAHASEVRHRLVVSENNIIEKQIPRLRAVAGRSEERGSLTERDVSAASIAPVKSTDSIPKSRPQMIGGEDDFNDAKFPLSIMLWCSQSLSSLFGSAKSL